MSGEIVLGDRERLRSYVNVTCKIQKKRDISVNYS